VTDLDNTLYDWVTYFARSFSKLVGELTLLLQVSEEQLLDEFRAIHVEHCDSEHPFAALELPSARRRFPALDRRGLAEALLPAFTAFNAERDRTLRLYDGVIEGIDRLRSMGIVVVGHTEATMPNAIFRLKKLGLVGMLSRLYALEGTPLPHPRRGVAPSAKGLEGFIVQVPRKERKPNPALLKDIAVREGVPIARTSYLGDSLTRDVSMAKLAGVRAIWAKYGRDYSASDWDTLVRVTHWTDTDVAREAALRQEFSDIRPDHTVDCFSEVVELLSASSSS